jgi:Mg-chelatase subunit ChlD
MLAGDGDGRRLFPADTLSYPERLIADAAIQIRAASAILSCLEGHDEWAQERKKIVFRLVGSRDCAGPWPAESQDVPFKLSIDVDHVVLQVTVQDGHGGFVSGLEGGDFSVYEDGRLQQIRFFRREDIPVTAGMVIDNSGSMCSKRAAVIEAARLFADSSNPGDEMFLVKFNDRVWMGLPESLQFTSSRSELEAALSRMMPGGQTALYDAIVTGLEQVARGPKDKKVLIVVSDGGDNASRRTVADVLRTAGRSNAIIYTIGLFDSEDSDGNRKILRRIANETGPEEECTRLHRFPASLRDAAISLAKSEISTRSDTPPIIHLMTAVIGGSK